MPTISGARRWWALGALTLAIVTFDLDLTIVNVALPTLATELDATSGQLQWFPNAYTLVVAAALLPAGKLGDRYGPKKLLLGAFALFGVAAVFCAYATSPGMLITGQAVLGLGAAFMPSLSLSLVNIIFPGAERAKALAVWSAGMTLGIPLGPIVGGWLLNNFWWGSIFLINVPLVLVGFAMLAVLVPNTPGTPGVRLDIPGVLLSSAGLVALTYGLIEAGESGWGATSVLVPLITGVLLLAVFVLWLRRAQAPIFDLRLFRSPAFASGTVLSTMVTFALMGSIFVLPQYFQAVFGANALGTGLRLVPVVGGMLVGVQVVGLVRKRLAAKGVVALGFGMLAIALVLGASTSVSDGYGYTALWLVIAGFGVGFALPTAMDVAVGSLEPQQSGVGSGLLQSVRQVGGTFGVAILGTVLSAGYAAQVSVSGLPDAAAEAVRKTPAAGVQVADTTGSPELLESVRAAFVHGMTNTMWVSAGIAVASIVATLVFLPRHAEDAQQSQQEQTPVAG